MKNSVALICTTFNCKDEVRSSLESFTRKENLDLLDEIVIVDGGSKDGTWELLEELASKTDKLSVYQVKGANISRGRNEAIKRTSSDIIVTFDSGTKYSENWLENMLAPFEKDYADVVGALTVCYGDTFFEKCLAVFGDQNRAAQKPSHRGCAFYKKVWEEIGGYPEHIQAGEDTWFNSQWEKRNYKFVHVPQAKSYWKVRSSWKALFKMQRRNTKGHIIIREHSGTPQVILITIVYLLLFLSVFLGFYDFRGWLFAAVMFALYAMKRLLGKGRWKFYINPVNFMMGIYVLTATDWGHAMGVIDGILVLLFERKRKKI